ncbi:MAG: DUF5132 domain-containing protein [Desulfobacterales bacterium]
MRILPTGLKTGSAMAIGAGVVILTPIVIPVLAGVMKPLVKAVIKGGMLAYENAKIAMEETKETLEDIAAEARSEIDAGQAKPANVAAKKAKK